jgi:alanine racemase
VARVGRGEGFKDQMALDVDREDEQLAAGDLEPFAQRPTWAEIDLDALAGNFQLIREWVPPDVKVMAVVKADAYGHGATHCAQRLAAERADWFGVALPEEGIALRETGIAQPILCLGGFWAGQEQACIRHALVPVVYRLDMVEAIDRAASAAGIVADLHLKIDTGMGRLGVRYDAVSDFADALRRFKHVRVDGVMTHFAAADDPDLDCFTSEQLTRFREAASLLRERGFNPTYEDTANSAATYGHKATLGNMVRPGGVLYGLWRDALPPTPEAPRLRPVMALHTRIMLLKRVSRGETLGYGCTFEASRETLVATLPVGYNDGYMRALSNRGRVIVRGTFAPVVGRISMDMTLVDVTDVEGVALNDRVTLLGEEDGLTVLAEDIAKTVGTISYEVTCGISHRVPRYYLPVEQE